MIEHFRHWLSEKLYCWSLKASPRIYDVAMWHEGDDLIHIACRRLSASQVDEREFVSYMDWLEYRDDPAVRRVISELRMESGHGDS